MIAPDNIGTLNISSHLSNTKFVVMIIEPLSLRLDKRLNKISLPSLSNDI